MITQQDKELLERVENEIRFHRLLKIARVSTAIGLVLSIFWFGWVNYQYANDINQLRKDYGKDWSCYLCGYESLKRTMCVYDKNIIINEEFRTFLGEENIQPCGLIPDVLTSNFSSGLTHQREENEDLI